jgi:hypothetical protein
MLPQGGYLSVGKPSGSPTAGVNVLKPVSVVLADATDGLLERKRFFILSSRPLTFFDSTTAR